MKKAPAWPPPDLLDLRDRFTQQAEEFAPLLAGRAPDRLALLRRLLEPRMERAWLEATKMAGSVGMVFFSVEYALDAAGRGHDKREERATKYLTLAKAARSFARAIYGTELDTTPYRWFPEDALDTLLNLMRADLREAGELAATLNGDGFGAYEVFHFVATPDYPNMAALAMAIAEEANQIARDAATEARILPRPEVTNARRLVFIRVLGSSWKLHGGQWLRRTLAAFATAALEEAITVDQVNDALRGFSPIPQRSRRFAKTRPRAAYLAPNDPRLK